ncbi:putative ribonuclease H-like domain-containing protein [Tanacetum coccineum]
MAFVSFSNNNTNNTNEVVNIAHGVSTASTQVNAANFTNIDNLIDVVICAFFASQLNSPQLVHEDLQQIHPDDMEEMDLRWKMTMLTMRARSPKWSATTATRVDTLLGSAELQEIKTTRIKKAQEGVCLWKYLLLLLWCHVMVLVDMTRVIRQRKGLIMHSWLSHLQILTQRLKVFPPPYTGNFMPPTPDLSFTSLDEFVNKPVVKNYDEEEDVSQPKIEKKIVRPIIVKKEFVKSKQQEKTARKTVKQGNPQMDLQDQEVIDSGCSRHMTENMSYLTYYEKIDGGYVAFRGNLKGGKITGKYTIKTGTQSTGLRLHKANPKSSQDDESNPLSDNGKKVDEDPRKESKCNDQEKEDNVNSTNNVNAISTNEICVGCKGDMKQFGYNNSKSVLFQLQELYRSFLLIKGIGDLQSATYKKDGQRIERNMEEPKKEIHALKDPSWIEAMQEELLQFKLQSFCFSGLQFEKGYRLLKWVFKEIKKKKDGIFISQDKYVEEILKKFGFIEVKTASTPMETQKHLLKDEDGEEVDVHMYRSMIGSLMYLTSSRPDIMFAVCACARYQVNPKVSHLHAVKRIFRVNLETKESLGKDASKHGRINAIDVDEEITMVSVHDDADKEMFDVDALNGEEVFVAGQNENIIEEVVDSAQVSTAATTVTITTKEITLAQALKALKPSNPKEDQIILDEETAKKLQAEFDEEERLAREKAEKEVEANIALIEEWDDIQAKIDVDYQLAERLQAQEQEELSIEEKATSFQQLLEKRRKHFAAKRAEEIRNKPPTKAQQRKIMCTYLKNMEGYKRKDLKSKRFDSIQEMFDKAFKRVNTFEDFRT